MEMDKKNVKELKKVFDILGWASQHIIQFAGSQEELVRGLKRMLAERDELKEKVVQLSSENHELKDWRKWLEKKVASLEARLEEKEGEARGSVKGERKRKGAAGRSKGPSAASTSNKRKLLEDSDADSESSDSSKKEKREEDDDSVIFLEEREGNPGVVGSSDDESDADSPSSDEEEASGVYVDQPVFVRRSTPMVSETVGAIRNTASTNKPRYHAFEPLTRGKEVNEALPSLVSYISGCVSGLGFENETDLDIMGRTLTLVQNLLNNAELNLGEHITKLWRSLVTCVISQGPGQGSGSGRRHWELQDKAVQLLMKLCKMSVTEEININFHVTTALSEVISREQAQPASLYGAVAVLGGLRNEAIRTALLPKVKAVGERVKNWLDSDSEADREAAQKLNTLMEGILGSFLESTKYARGSTLAFRQQFGYFATVLQNHLSGVGRRRKRGSSANLQRSHGGYTNQN